MATEDNDICRTQALRPTTDPQRALRVLSALRCRQNKSLRRTWAIEARQSGRVQAQLDAARSITFDDCREKFIASHRAAWANDKHLSNGKVPQETMSARCLVHCRCRTLTSPWC